MLRVFRIVEERFFYLEIKNKNRQRSKGERWRSLINGVKGIGTSYGVIKRKVTTIECRF